MKQQSFDAVKYFNVPYSSQNEYWELTKSINTSLADYLLIRLAELLPSEKLEHITNLNDIFSLAETLPNYKTTVVSILADFKREVLKTS